MTDNKDAVDPKSLPKVNTDTSVDSDAKGGATNRNIDLPTGLRRLGRLAAIFGGTKKAETSQKPSDN